MSELGKEFLKRIWQWNTENTVNVLDENSSTPGSMSSVQVEKTAFIDLFVSFLLYLYKPLPQTGKLIDQS